MKKSSHIFNYKKDQPISGQDSLNDSKRALQFIRYYAQSLNIKKDDIVLMGSSAGAGTSLWLALHDDMADPGNSDSVLKESTRVKGVYANVTQATYDLKKWPTDVFQEYQPQGFTFQTVIDLYDEARIVPFYGMDSIAQIDSPAIVEYRKKVDMLGILSGDDPDLYLLSGEQPYQFPTTFGNLVHHPLQAKAVQKAALSVGVTVQADIPEIGINTTNGETGLGFMKRKLEQ